MLLETQILVTRENQSTALKILNFAGLTISWRFSLYDVWPEFHQIRLKFGHHQNVSEDVPATLVYHIRKHEIIFELLEK